MEYTEVELCDVEQIRKRAARLPQYPMTYLPSLYRIKLIACLILLYLYFYEKLPANTFQAMVIFERLMRHKGDCVIFAIIISLI